MSLDNYYSEVTTRPGEVLRKYALLEYATLYWHLHVQNSKTLKTEEMILNRLRDTWETNLAFQAFLAWTCVRSVSRWVRRW
jgi:hypothetical protein